MASSSSSIDSIPAPRPRGERMLLCKLRRRPCLQPDLELLLLEAKPWMRSQKWLALSTISCPNQGKRGKKNQADDRLYILSVTCLDEDLVEYRLSEVFNAFGKIQKVRGYYDDYGRSTGRWDILYAQKESAILAYNAIKRCKSRLGLASLKAKLLFKPRL